jgi:hypothetical protein
MVWSGHCGPLVFRLKKDLVIRKPGVARFVPGVVWRQEVEPAALETVACG